MFSLKLYEEGFDLAGFDTRTFNELLVVVGKTTWEVMNARKKLKVEWEPITETKETVNNFGRKQEVVIPAGLPSSDEQYQKMQARAKEPADGA